MKAMSVKYKMLSDKNNIDNDRLYRPAALSELLEAWLAVFESRRPHRGDGKHNRQSPDTADTYQNWPGMINNPGTVSRVTNALPPYGQCVQGQISLSTALQAGL